MERANWRTPVLAVMAGTLVFIIAIGLRNTFGLYLRPMTEAYGWGRELFALAIAVQNLTWGLSAPLTGGLADRYGTGRVITFGAICYALGLYLMSQTDTPGLLMLSTGLLIGLGVSATGFGVVFGAVARVASDERRSLYLGITAAGGSLGQGLLVPLSQGAISAYGWSTALTLAAGLSLVMILLAMVLTGRAETGPEATGTPTSAASPVRAFQEAGKETRYWLLFWGFFVCGFHITFVGTHLPAFLTDQNIAPSVAALALATIGGFNILGSIVFGYLGGRYSKRKVLSALYAARALVIASLVVLPLSTYSVLAFAAGMGFLWLGTVPLTSGLVGQMYGVRYMNTLFSVVFLGHQLGAFLGVWAGGWVYDVTGSYTPVWIAAIALGVFAALVHLPIDERHRDEFAASRQVAPASAD